MRGHNYASIQKQLLKLEIRKKNFLANPSIAQAYADKIKYGKGILSNHGALVVYSGKHMSRTPDAQFIGYEGQAIDKVNWGDTNQPMAPEDIVRLQYKVTSWLSTQRKRLYVSDHFVCMNPEHETKLRFITNDPAARIFANHMFGRPTEEQLENGHEPDFTILHAPDFKATPKEDKTKSEAFVIIDLKRKLILIGGTAYAGEIKKSVFRLLQYVLPQLKVLTMHASANEGKKGDTAIFFGLSGTGKTTLSADPERKLIGDDEHGWGENDIFNFEGGCYAKLIRLDPLQEPEIWEMLRKFGTVVENVPVDPISGRLDLNSTAYTENTRAAYSLNNYPNAVRIGRGGHPSNIFMLCYDGFGALPPLAKLTPEQAQHHLLCGFTSKVAKTEGDLDFSITFSTCYGAAFLPLPAKEYIGLFKEKLLTHKPNVWLVNTGMCGGRYGVGTRYEQLTTKHLIKYAIESRGKDELFVYNKELNLMVPKYVEGLADQDILNPRHKWGNRQDEYTQALNELKGKFIDHLAQYKGSVPSEVLDAGLRFG